jgi:uncharacterized RDD family membrane protein YckC
MFGLEESVGRPGAPAGTQIAPLTRRVGGFVLDQLIVVVPVVLGALAFGFEPGDKISNDAVFGLSTATIVLGIVYHTLMIGFLGRTVGKMAAGTKVVNAVDGERVGWTGASMRALVPLAAGAIPQVGFALSIGVYAVALLSPLRQGLHDRAAGTLVVLSATFVPPS